MLVVVAFLTLGACGSSTSGPPLQDITEIRVREGRTVTDRQALRDVSRILTQAEPVTTPSGAWTHTLWFGGVEARWLYDAATGELRPLQIKAPPTWRVREADRLPLNEILGPPPPLRPAG